jgi:tRNA pseudouridine38-40 synthase
VAVGERRPGGGRTFRAVLEYDGTDFHGWQVQAGGRTVQGVLEEAIAAIHGSRAPVVAAGRTDAGVHAEGQVVSFRAATALAPERLAAALNARLPADVSVLSLEEAPPGFHAVRDAVSKVYRYGLLQGRESRPLLRRITWRVPQRLNLARMRRAAALLVGRHDFRSFRTNPGVGEGALGTVRTLHRLDVRRRGDLVTVEAEGDGFLYNMVRCIVGTLVDVGRGRWPPERVGEILEARDRSAAGPTAPARGLVLVSVDYGGRGTGDGAGGPRRAGGGKRRIPSPPRTPRMGRNDGRRASRRPREAKP